MDSLTSTFSALNNRQRRAILEHLAHSDATVGELIAPLHISQPSMSRHVRELVKVGLVTQGRDRQFRPCRIKLERIREVRDWFDGLLEKGQERMTG